MKNEFDKKHMDSLIKMTKQGQKLPTVGDLLDSLEGIDRHTEVALRFLPVEGRHRGAGASDVPFVVDPVTDAGDEVVVVYLTEQ